MSELDDFGKVLMRDVRDRVIGELFGQLEGKNDGPMPNELMKEIMQISGSVGDTAVRQTVIYAVDQVITEILYLMYQSQNGILHTNFTVFGASGVDLASLSDGIHTEQFGSEGWIERYSAFPECLVDGE